MKPAKNTEAAKRNNFHLRCKPEHKRMLAALANLTTDGNETQYFLKLLEERAHSQMVVGCLGEISLPKALDFCEKAATPIQKMLRMFFVGPAALGRKERHMSQTIMENPLYFDGNDPVFDDDEQWTPTMRARVSKVDVARVQSHLQVLADYYEFMCNNSRMQMSYAEYRKRTGESD